MEAMIPRVLLAGTRSGCGKTTVTVAVLQALIDRGLRTGAFKCGPDYIDPMFHARVIGAVSGNLDPFFFDENTLNFLLAKNAADCAVSVIEGVMGYYDGVGMTARASTYEVARVTRSPAVQVVDARGAALSALAEIGGFLNFLPDSRISGVIFNRCAAGSYKLLSDAVLEHFGGRVRPLGYLPPMPECALESRHLGLVTAAEVSDLREKLRALSAQAEKSIDLEGLISLAQDAPPVACGPVTLPRFAESIRVAVARDRAFCFYYEDSLDALRGMGAELVDFSPLTDPALPGGTDGLYLGGGYPELYIEELTGNRTMLDSVRAALAAGLPCIAECGGFLYLTERFAGALPGNCFDAGRLTRFGYVTLTAKRDNLLCRAGESIPAHEFHRWDCEDPGADFTAEKPTGKRWDCAVATKTLYAGFPHFHFYANISFAVNFYKTCLEVKRGHETDGDRAAQL